MTGVLAAVLIFMLITPLGTIRLPMVSITVAHVPILIASIILGFMPGFILAIIFGLASMTLAVINPSGVLDVFFINPCVSVLPRLFIPVMTWLCFKFMSKIFTGKKILIAICLSLAIGNLTNTFGVYFMIYLIYAKKILEITGQNAKSFILSLMALSTIWKCIGIVLIVSPIILALEAKNKA